MDIHWKDKTKLGERAHFRTVQTPAVLAINNVRETDEGEYRCRVDFSGSPTRNSRMFLSILGKIMKRKYEWRSLQYRSPRTALRINNDFLYLVLIIPPICLIGRVTTPHFLIAQRVIQKLRTRR